MADDVDLSLRRVKCDYACCANCEYARGSERDLVEGHGITESVTLLACFHPGRLWYRYVRDLDVCKGHRLKEENKGVEP